MFDMATSAYLSQGGPPNSSDQEDGVMNLVNPAVSQGYSIPREQVVGLHFVSPTNYKDIMIPSYRYAYHVQKTTLQCGNRPNQLPTRH